eukprot:scaffold177089_cov20-Prasinocladus_malaysianus.AAC.1
MIQQYRTRTGDQSEPRNARQSDVLLRSMSKAHRITVGLIAAPRRKRNLFFQWSLSEFQFNTSGSLVRAMLAVGTSTSRGLGIAAYQHEYCTRTRDGRADRLQTTTVSSD